MISFKENLITIFDDNLLFLGLQGSYGRGEAKGTSDIDPVIILRKCGKEELLKYRHYIDSIAEKDILCGFIASSEELNAWESGDRAQLILDTQPFYGDLSSIIPPITEDDIRRAVQQDACAIYHATSHNILHARAWSILPSLYKSAKFTIRMNHYRKTGNYIPAFKDLEKAVCERERRILNSQLKETEEEAFTLLEWASDTLLDM